GSHSAESSQGPSLSWLGKCPQQARAPHLSLARADSRAESSVPLTAQTLVAAQTLAAKTASRPQTPLLATAPGHRAWIADSSSSTMTVSEAAPRGAALVIGGSGRLGRPLCAALAREWDGVVFSYRRNGEAARQVQASLGDTPSDYCALDGRD